MYSFSTIIRIFEASGSGREIGKAPLPFGSAGSNNHRESGEKAPVVKLSSEVSLGKILPLHLRLNLLSERMVAMRMRGPQWLGMSRPIKMLGRLLSVLEMMKGSRGSG